MTGNTRLRILVIVAFLAACSFLYFAFQRMQENVSILVQSVEEASRPDRQLISIKEVWTTFRGVGNDVRAFSVTRDERYLEAFLDLKDDLVQTIDSLKSQNELSGKPTAAYDTLQRLFNNKAGIYENLLDISYNRVVGEAVSKMKSSEPEIDTTAFATEEGNVLQRIFSAKYSRRSLQARADSILAERNKLQMDYNKNLKLIRQEEERLLQEQADKELALLEEDAAVTASIESLITRLENEERARITNEIESSRKQADETARVIRMMIIGGVALILLLFLLVLIDIEISGRRKKELMLARKKAEKLAGAREEFIATMSHEIRTPLTSIIGFSGKLVHTKLSDEQERYLKAIRGSSNHLLAVVNDVLDYSRIESGKLKFDEVSFKPADIFAEVFEALKWKADEKNIRMNLYAQPVMETVLYGDPVRLRQVLFNLAGNAIKFTEKGSVDITVTAINENENPVLLFKVSDTGIGIPLAKLETIFEEYEQATGGTEREYGGTGLGLAISKKITDQLGGTITVESNPGLGSVFSVRLPYKWGEIPLAETSFTEDIVQKPFLNLSIIIAEDDALIRELQSKNLEDAGAKVYVAVNGKEALELFSKHYADILILDVQMPEMSGPEAVRIIRNEFPDDKKNVPVIAMTANILQHDLKKYMEEGMNDFITKPFRDNELFDKIRRLLEIGDIGQTVSVPELIEEPIPDAEPLLAPGQKPYDLDELIASSHGNREFVKKMINLFLTSSYASLNNLKFHLKQNNSEQLGKTAHRMIGSFKQMGADHVAILLKDLEATCYDESARGKAAYLVTEIEKYSNQIFELLKIELKEY